MEGKEKIELDFVIDKLTNSIQNTITGDSFATEVSRFTIRDLKSVTKKNGWLFNWKKELNDDKKEVYKLTIVNNSNIIQGLISLSKDVDHIFMNLLESAPFNLGKNKMYDGVAGNLVAYACKISFQQGFEGFIAFTAKTALIEHYIKTLGAYRFGGQRMIIPTHASRILVEKYFKT
ncbi:MAG: hypothetical protein LBO74_07850 [Candidatus Symbiothrix sp.]|jgi:hypothetical protein|nr:hypothetical protein [Candidatus Symbiothrix sp.]